MYRSRVPHDILDAFTGIPFEEDYGKGRPVKIDILIGLDNYWALMNNKCVKSTSGLVAQETAFGWMLSGAWYNDRSRSEQNHDQSMNNASKTRSLFCQTEMAVSETEIRRMWDLDSIGIGPEESEDDKMLDNFNKEIKWNGERYTVKLPWKDTSCKETLMNNKTQALSRLNSLSKKLNKNPDMKARFDAVLEDLPVWLTNTKTDSAEEILDVFETNEEQGAENTSDGEQESRAKDIMATVSTQIENPINFDRFSRLTRAVRVMAWILRFAKNARCTQRKESSPDLSSAEIETGRIMVLKSIQNEFYNEEISDLKNGKCVRKTSSIYQLSPFIG